MKYLLTTLLLVISNLLLAQIGIGTTNPDASAALEIKSTTQGLLMPRMTEAQRDAIVAPVAGLFVFNLDFNCFQFYNGTAWSKCLTEVQSNKLACGTVAANGVAVVGTALSVNNTLTIDVVVNFIDTYTFTTNTVNGYSFSKSGVFTSIGINTITMVGTGTPVAAQTDAFTITYVEKGLTCAVSNTVLAQPKKNCLEYKNAGSNTDGIYAIDPDGVGGAAAFNCYCDMTNNGGGWTLVFNHDITAGGLWASDAEADQFNITSPGLSTSKYSILYKIDAIKNNPAKYEFRLNYPELVAPNKTNHWTQTFDPRSGFSPTNPVAGYVSISTPLTENSWGGLENSTTTNTYLDGTVNAANWWYSIGSQNSYPSASPLGIPASSTSVTKVQLFIR